MSEEIIRDIEEIFEGYQQDSELAAILYNNEIMYPLFPKHNDQTYYLSTGTGKTSGIVFSDKIGRLSSSSSINAARNYVEYLNFKQVEPLTISTVRMRLDQNLGRRVRTIKQYYATLEEIEE